MREVAGPSETGRDECAKCGACRGPHHANLLLCASRGSQRAYDDCPGQATIGPIRDRLVPPILPAPADPRVTACQGALPSGHIRYCGPVCSVTENGLLLQEARSSAGPLASPFSRARRPRRRDMIRSDSSDWWICVIAIAEGRDPFPGHGPEMSVLVKWANNLIMT